MFKVGDNVKYKKGEIGYPSQEPSNNYTVQCVQEGKVFLFQRNNFIGISGSMCNCGFHTWEAYNTQLELISTVGTNNPVAKIMSSVKEFAKNLILGEDEKLLRKQGLKDSCGGYTTDAKDIVMDIVCKANEAELIKIAKAKEVEETKK